MPGKVRQLELGLRGCVTGELVLRKAGFAPWDYEHARFVAEGVEISAGVVVLLSPSITFTSKIGGTALPSFHERHVGRWCVPISRVQTLTYDECAS